MKSQDLLYLLQSILQLRGNPTLKELIKQTQTNILYLVEILKQKLISECTKHTKEWLSLTEINKSLQKFKKSKF